MVVLCYNVLNDSKTFYEKPNRNEARADENIRKIASNQRVDCARKIYC